MNKNCCEERIMYLNSSNHSIIFVKNYKYILPFYIIIAKISILKKIINKFLTGFLLFLYTIPFKLYLGN